MLIIKLFLQFVYSNKDKQANKGKQNCYKNSRKSLIYLLGGVTANNVNFMQHMLVSHSSCYFSSLEGNIAEVSKILTSGN